VPSREGEATVEGEGEGEGESEAGWAEAEAETEAETEAEAEAGSCSCSPLFCSCPDAHARSVDSTLAGSGIETRRPVVQWHVSHWMDRWGVT
jgi:hypothetical protein